MIPYRLFLPPNPVLLGIGNADGTYDGGESQWIDAEIIPASGRSQSSDPLPSEAAAADSEAFLVFSA